MGGCGFCISCAFFSATQDITVDAFRIEATDSQYQAILAATYQTGYRLAMIWAGAGALALAAWGDDAHGGYQAHAWCLAYCFMAISM